MKRETILVVDDEPSIRELLRVNLEKDGYSVLLAEDGRGALEAARRHLPDLILLDLMLPETDGLDVCRDLKADPATSHIPILMVTARGDEVDIVTGLELGADDYISKPFSPRVVRARVKAVLRRGRREKSVTTETPIRIHNLSIHPGRHEVLVDSEAVCLTPTEFRVLYFLAGKPGWVYTRYQIVDGVRGADCAVTDRAVDVQIVALRRKLASAGHLIETVRGVGYRFKEEV